MFENLLFIFNKLCFLEEHDRHLISIFSLVFTDFNFNYGFSIFFLTFKNSLILLSLTFLVLLFFLELSDLFTFLVIF